MDNINFEKVCRTCVTEQTKMVNICTKVNCNGTFLTITKILNSFVSIEIVEDDAFPNLVCSNCLENAINTYNFKVMCDQSYSFLQECHKKISVKSESLGVDNNFNTCLVDIKKEETNEEYLSYSNVTDESNTLKLRSKRKIKKKAELLTCNEDEVCTSDSQINKDLGLIYFCSECNKSFKNKYIFIAHEKRHEFKGQFLCNVCGKGFSSQSCLNRHNRVHTGEKKYECPECHKRFPSSNNLNLHSRIHSGHKPYLCTVCGKRFSHPTGLTYHMRTHTNEKPYSCNLCGKRFAIQCHFDRHKKTHSGERPFACMQCGRAFIKKIDLQRHEEIHSGLKPHTCSICKKSFLRIKNLNYHMMLHTEERPHICIECGKGFIRPYYLKDHIRKHHMKEEKVVV